MGGVIPPTTTAILPYKKKDYRNMKNVRKIEIVSLEKEKLFEIIKTIGTLSDVQLVINASLSNGTYDVCIMSNKPIMLQSSDDYGICITIVQHDYTTHDHFFIDDNEYYQISL